MNEITPTLRWTDRGGRQQAVQMVERRPAFVVGNEGDVMLDDPLVSPRHARFERTEQTWRAIDCESTGLWLRRADMRGRRWERVRRVELIHADEIRLGQTILRYSVIPEEPENTPWLRMREFTQTEAKTLNLLCRPAHERTRAWASNDDIATELDMPHNTLRSHLRSIYQEFGLDGIADYRKRAIVVQRALLLGYGGRP